MKNYYYKFKKEISENRRLKYGFIFIIIILIIYSLIMLNNFRELTFKEYINIKNHFFKLSDIEQQKDWIAFVKKSNALKVATEDKLWIAESKGVAQASIQSWFSQVIRQSNIGNTTFQVELSTNQIQKLWKVSVQIKGEFEANTFLTLLNSIESNPFLIVIERLSIENTNRKRFDLVIAIFFKAIDEQK